MKALYLFLTATLVTLNLQAQQFDWAKHEGLYQYDYGYGVATDNNGNVYFAGKYEDTANFSGVTLPNQGNHDIWLAKYSSSGTLNWIRTAGGTSGDYAWGVACDNSFLYIAGEIEGFNELITFVGSPITLTCINNNDIFVAKYDLSGNLLWARSAGGFEYEKALSVTYDNAGNVYICGLYRGTVTFGGSTTINCTTDGINDIFIAKYDANGNFLWVQHAGSAGRDEAKSIKCDAAGNVYICGMYADSCVFGSQILHTYNNSIYNDAFLAKYSPAGALQWVKTAGGDYDDVAWSLTIDNSGKIYVTGEFNAYAVFDGIPLITAGRADIFVTCYNSSGTIQWAKRAGGPLDDRARGIGTDGTGLFITGQFGATVPFDTHSVTSADSSDIFIAALNNTGTFLWALSVGGAPDAYENLGYESGIAVTADAAGHVFATGALLDDGVFGSTSLTAYSRTDVFITRISQLVGVEEVASNAGDISIYPNPSNGVFTISSSRFSISGLNVFNALGENVYSSSKTTSIGKESSGQTSSHFDISSLKRGIYFIELKGDWQFIYRGKIIIQ
jgi:hypothetical protein